MRLSSGVVVGSEASSRLSNVSYFTRTSKLTENLATDSLGIADALELVGVL